MNLQPSRPSQSELARAIERTAAANEALLPTQFNLNGLQRRREVLQASFKKKLAVGMIAVAGAIGLTAVVVNGLESANNQSEQIGQAASQGLAHGEAVRNASIAAQEGLTPVNTGLNTQGQVVTTQP